MPARGPHGRGDLVLLAAVGSLVALGILMVLNVTYFYGQHHYGDPFRFFRRHLIAVASGAVALVLASRAPLMAYERAARPFVVLGVLGLLLVLSPLGVQHDGAQRWLSVGGISVQPSEFAKLALVFYLAWWLAKHRERLSEVKLSRLSPLIVTTVAAGLLLLEPDFGTAVLVGTVLLTMLFVAGVPHSRLVTILLVAVPVAVSAVVFVQYRRVRWLSFLDPWSDPRNTGFQLVQSLLAVGSGGLTGLGLGESRQKMFYLPAAHTDFVFAVIGEELGLLGALGVVTAFLLLALRGGRIALRHADPFGRLLAFGLTTSLMLQAVVNTAVVLGLLPTKGLALPFVSYGGSAMVAALTSTGILYGLSRETG